MKLFKVPFQLLSPSLPTRTIHTACFLPPSSSPTPCRWYSTSPLSPLAGSPTSPPFISPSSTSLSFSSSTSIPPPSTLRGVATRPREDNFEEEEEKLHDDPRDRVLEASLGYVNRMGWSIEALVAGAQDVGLPGVAHGLFPGGGFDLVIYFEHKCNQQMSLKLQVLDLKSMTVREKVRKAIHIRLSLLAPYISSWPQAMKLAANPRDAPKKVEILSMLADEIWHHAGDTSVDISWYTKRAMIGAVYTSSEIFMMIDSSEGFRDTWSFVDRRVDNVISMSKLASEVDHTMATALHGFSSLFSSK